MHALSLVAALPRKQQAKQLTVACFSAVLECGDESCWYQLISQGVGKLALPTLARMLFLPTYAPNHLPSRPPNSFNSGVCVWKHTQQHRRATLRLGLVRTYYAVPSVVTVSIRFHRRPFKAFISPSLVPMPMPMPIPTSMLRPH